MEGAPALESCISRGCHGRYTTGQGKTDFEFLQMLESLYHPLRAGPSWTTIPERALPRTYFDHAARITYLHELPRR